MTRLTLTAIVLRKSRWSKDRAGIVSFNEYASYVSRSRARGAEVEYRDAIVWADDDNWFEAMRLRPLAVIAPRYEDFSADNAFMSGNNKVHWTLALDILISGQSPVTSGTATKDAFASLYNPWRGRIIEKVLQLLADYPTLSRIPNLDSGVTVVGISDITDLNLWTLLWSYGAPESFNGWWPSTMGLKVTQRLDNLSVVWPTA